MAVVRMVDGCNEMANRKFLEPREKTKKSVKHQSHPVEYVCACFLDNINTQASLVDLVVQFLLPTMCDDTYKMGYVGDV